MSIATEAQQKSLNRAKIALMKRPNFTFYTVIMMSLNIQWTDSPEHETLATNGKDMFINPQFWDTLSKELQLSALFHEVLHVAYDHMGRLHGRNHEKWNSAADFVINLIMKDAKFEIGASWLLDEKFRGMSADEVYRLLPDSLPKNGMSDLLKPSTGQSQHDQHIKSVLVRAAMQSKQRGDAPGSIPGDVQLFLDNLLNPKLPWQNILRKFLKMFDKSNYSFRMPNRRFMPAHYLPSLHGQKLLNLAIAVDISGSVSDEEFKRMVSEVNGILRMMKPDLITLLQFDTDIKSVHKVKSVRELSQVEFKGRGGTRVEPVFKWADDNKPQALLIFTDGGFHFYGPQTKVPTIWLIHDNKGFQAPFGDIVHYQMAEPA